MGYTKDEAAARILSACRQLVEKGLIARTWGNVSARLCDGGFLITPSGRDYESLTEEDLVRVDLKSESWEGDVKPSSEKSMHAGLYRLRPECGFIIHTHQANASAISVLGEDIELTTLQGHVISREEERQVLGKVIPCAFYGLSSTKRLARRVVAAAKEHPDSQAILMHYHGTVCMGADDEEAFKVAETLETVCGRVYEKRTGEKLPAGNAGMARYDIHESNGIFRIHTRTPYIMEMSRRGKTLFPYLDDMAQIGGTSIHCISEAPASAEFRRAIKGRNAVLIKGDGAVCLADTSDEAKAVAQVLEKNCQAANLALKKAIPPVDRISAKLERTVYLQKYSRLKTAAEAKTAVEAKSTAEAKTAADAGAQDEGDSSC